MQTFRIVSQSHLLPLLKFCHMNEEFNSALIVYQMASYSISATFTVLRNYINWQLLLLLVQPQHPARKGTATDENKAFGKVRVVGETCPISHHVLLLLFSCHESNLEGGAQINLYGHSCNKKKKKQLTKH